MAGNVKHGQYITQLTAVRSNYKQINADQIAAAGGVDLNGANFSLGYSYLTEPFLMVAEAHTHTFDQIIFILGGDPTNITNLDAEVEMSLGEPLTKYTITYPACIYIPAGLMHCPLNFKSIKKPLQFIDITLHPGMSVRPLPPTSRRDS